MNLELFFSSIPFFKSALVCFAALDFKTYIGAKQILKKQAARLLQRDWWTLSGGLRGVEPLLVYRAIATKRKLWDMADSAPR